jgi:hypothetical protein
VDIFSTDIHLMGQRCKVVKNHICRDRYKNENNRKFLKLPVGFSSNCATYLRPNQLLTQVLIVSKLICNIYIDLDQVDDGIPRGSTLVRYIVISEMLLARFVLSISKDTGFKSSK